VFEPGKPQAIYHAARRPEIVSESTFPSIRPRIKNRDYTETSPHTEKALGWLAATGEKKIGQEFPEKEIETKREGSS